MTLNPYQPATDSVSDRRSRRGVRRYWLAFALGMLGSVLFGVPGLIILNQELSIIPPSQAYPPTTSYYQIIIFGVPTSNATGIACTLATATLFLVVGLLCGAIAVRNRRENKRLAP